MALNLNELKAEFILDYIKRIQDWKNSELLEDNIFDLIIEIANVLQNEIPEIQNSVLLRSGTEIRDANTTISLLRLYLINNGIKIPKVESDENRNIKRFWSSFLLWFEKELPSMELLKDQYLIWDNWNGGTYYLNLDYNYEFQLYRGIEYPNSLKANLGDIEDIKTFLEIAYKYWIINEGKHHYQFTVEVNDRLRIFKLPYKLQYGILLKQGYKTSFEVDKIVDYKMFERKIQFSEQMISSKDLMEKKSGLDFIIDSLQYLISKQEGNRNLQYASLAKSVNANVNSKVYSVIKSELNELMKLSNEYFDIRHNDYLNAAKEHREALNDPQFIEYLYNRAYSLLYILRLKINLDNNKS